MSLGTSTRSLMRTAKKQFPGASDADLRQWVLLQVSVALQHPSNTVKDADLLKLAEASLDEAATEGESWAVSLKNSVRDSIVRPLVDKARAKGVDPVPVVVVETGLSADEVRSMIEALDADAANAEASTDDLEETDAESDDETPVYSSAVSPQY